MYDHTFSKLANHQIRHQATNKVGCQPGDCIWPLQSSSGVCVGMYGLIYSLYHPQGVGRGRKMCWGVLAGETAKQTVTSKDIW